jgi:gas vesicle protein
MTKNKTGVQVAEAGILGAVIGAAVGAGAVALSNDKNQKFIKNKFNDLKEQGQKIMNDIQSKADELTTTGKEKVEEKVKGLRSNLEGYKKGIKAKL